MIHRTSCETARLFREFRKKHTSREPVGIQVREPTMRVMTSPFRDGHAVDTGWPLELDRPNANRSSARC